MKTKNILKCFFLGVFTPCCLLAQEVPSASCSIGRGDNISLESTEAAKILRNKISGLTPTPMMFNAKELQEGKKIIGELLSQEEHNIFSVVRINPSVEYARESTDNQSNLSNFNQRIDQPIADSRQPIASTVVLSKEAGLSVEPERAALEQESAKQFEDAADYYAQSAQEYLLNRESEDGFRWARVGGSLKKSATCLSQVIKYRDQASLAQTEGHSQLASCWMKAAEKSQIAAEYYKKNYKLSMTENLDKSKRYHMRYNELNETEFAADTYQAISQYWDHAAEAFNLKTRIETGDLSQYTLPQNVFSEPSRTVKVCHGSVKTILEQSPYEISSSSIPVFRFNATDEESAELWIKAAEQMQVYADYEQATIEKRALEKITMYTYSTANSSLQCAARHLADAAGYSEQVFQSQDALETATLFRKAKEQSEVASERAKESAQAHQLENRKEGNDLGTSARILWRSARSFAAVALCLSIEAKQSMTNAAEQWSKSSDAYKIGNTQEGCWLNKSAEYFEDSANHLNKASEYNVRASQYQASEQSEQAALLTQAAENSKIAAEYRSKGAHAYAVGNKEEGESWRDKARSVEETICRLASSFRSLN